MKIVLVLGLEAYKTKNNYQFECLNSYKFLVFSNDLLSQSNETKLLKNVSLYVLNKNFIKRLSLLIKIILKEKKNISHTEIYTGGRFCIFYFIICSIFGISIIAVERGDIRRYDNYPILSKIGMRILYKQSNIVWYKEPYMLEILKNKFFSKKTFFLPNAVPSYTENKNVNRDIDFLWVNRLIEERKATWVIDAFEESDLQDCNLCVLGFIEEKSEEKTTITQQKYILSKKIEKLEIHGFIDPIPYYKRAKYFVLPSKYVFGNYALLEAMSFGVVPIITKDGSIEQFINSSNGFISEYNKYDFIKSMVKAKNISEKERSEKSKKISNLITSEFSINKQKSKFLELYSKI